MVLFLRNNRLNVTLILADYQLRWWRLPIEERACRKKHLSGGDYSLGILDYPPHPLIFVQISNNLLKFNVLTVSTVSEAQYMYS